MSKARELARPVHPDADVRPDGRRRGRARYWITAVICGWAAYHYFMVQQPQLTELQHKQAQLQSQLQAMQQQQANLQAEKTEFQSDAYIARYASQHFGLALPGQVPFDIH